MVATTWPEQAIKWFSITFIGLSVTVLLSYTVFMSYFNSKITDGFMKNRDRVFEELYQEKKKKNKFTTAEGSSSKVTEGDGSKEKGEDEEKNAPYLIAGFFHPYWYAH
jgi:alpha-1,2-mannosyltransferase